MARTTARASNQRGGKSRAQASNQRGGKSRAQASNQRGGKSRAQASNPRGGRSAAQQSGRESFLPENRIDRWLAGGFVGLLGLSILCFILLMLASGLRWFGDLLGPIYVATVAAVVYFGIPIAVVLMIVLTVRLALRRRKENQRA